MLTTQQIVKFKNQNAFLPVK